MTLVSHRHKFIFLKTRKTAGTSVEMYLQPFCTPDDTPVVEKCEAIVSKYGIVGQRLGREGRAKPAANPALRDVWFSHHDAKDLRKQLPWGVWRRYTKIAVLRNPYRRVLSGFFWRNRGTLNDLPMNKRVERFRASLANGKMADDRRIVFIGNKFQPDVILRTERLSSELPALMERLNLDPSKTSLPQTKVSTQGKKLPLSDWYDDAGTELVLQNYGWMFDLGGYSKDITTEDPISSKVHEAIA